ncbi:MAG: hypothetical protein IPK59_03925 [Rhodospirillaceae bacterium]|nr:hypothetical protein [Rhodospirillaceae bacterium]
MTEISLKGTTLSAELLFLAASIEPNEAFELTGEQCEGTAGFLDHLIKWAETVEETVGDKCKPIAFCIQGLADFFHAAHEADGISLDADARHKLRTSAMATYHLAKEAEGLAPFEIRFPDWRMPAEAPANDQVAAG